MSVYLKEKKKKERHHEIQFQTTSEKKKSAFKKKKTFIMTELSDATNLEDRQTFQRDCSSK